MKVHFQNITDIVSITTDKIKCHFMQEKKTLLRWNLLIGNVHNDDFCVGDKEIQYAVYLAP